MCMNWPNLPERVPIPFARFRESVGQTHSTPWVVVDQATIDQFAEVTGDDALIHVDPEFAARTRFGGTIAHGLLTLSLLPRMARWAMPLISDSRMGVNYGFDSVRFLAPVPSGARVRGQFTLTAVEPKPRNLWVIRHDVVIEAAPGVGGTWYWNRYPGARCDIESVQYSLGMFPEIDQEWRWSEKFASQPEILAYIEHVVERRGLAKWMRLNTRVNAARFDEDSATWQIATSQGAPVRARFVIMATGTLSTTNMPDLPGFANFKGAVYHTGQWPETPVDFTGLKVGVIGTGSSGIQLIPVLAQQAEKLTVYLRTPYYVVPARNRPLTDDEVATVKARYPELRAAWKATPNALGMNFGKLSAREVDPETRDAMFEEAWQFGGGDFGACFSDLTRNMDSNDEVRRWFGQKIASIVKDPDTAARLTPTVRFGTRRLCVGTDYYKTYNRPNVSLVDLRETPIEGFTAGGIVTGGTEHKLDALILATGFDAVTGTLLRIDFTGRGGLTLRESWREGPRTFLGTCVAGFPNLFMISGPQSPGTLINVACGVEVGADWIGRCLSWLRDHGKATIEPTFAAQADWLERTVAVAERSLMSKGDSWWTGGNIPGKPRGYLGYLDWPGFVARCEEVAANRYEGFILADEIGAGAAAAAAPAA